MLHIKLKEMEHRIPCLPACVEFGGLLMIFAISVNPGQDVRDFFYIFLTWSTACCTGLLMTIYWTLIISF